MDIMRKVSVVLLVNVTAKVGSSVGNALGAFVRDQLKAQRRRAQGLPEPEKQIYLQTLGQNAPAAPTLAAMVLALQAPRRRPLWGFVIAVVLAALVGDRFDGILLDRIPNKATAPAQHVDESVDLGNCGPNTSIGPAPGWADQ